MNKDPVDGGTKLGYNAADVRQITRAEAEAVRVGDRLTLVVKVGGREAVVGTTYEVLRVHSDPSWGIYVDLAGLDDGNGYWIDNFKVAQPSHTSVLLGLLGVPRI